jgi:hypothetical protein
MPSTPCEQAAALGTADAKANIEPRDEADVMTALGETSETTEANWGERLRMLEAYTAAYEADAPNPYELWPNEPGSRDGYST